MERSFDRLAGGGGGISSRIAAALIAGTPSGSAWLSWGEERCGMRLQLLGDGLKGFALRTSLDAPVQAAHHAALFIPA